jgi:hypothetical protein
MSLMLGPMRRALIPAALLLLAATPAAAAQHIYSYDSNSPITEKMTEAGLSFIFDKHLMGVTVKRILETHNVGSADLRPVSESVLGRGGVEAVVGDDARERDLYEISEKGDGRALRNALCRGSDHVWLAFGRLKSGQDLRIRALGHDAQTGRTRLCVTLDYTYRGEWRLPQSVLDQPDRTDRFNDAPNRLPY